MDDYTALSDDSFDDFIVSGNRQEKQNSKDTEGILKTFPERNHFSVKLRFKILEFYPVMPLHTFKNFEQKLSNSLGCEGDEVGKLFWNTYGPSSSRGLNRCYILQLILVDILWSTLKQKFKNFTPVKVFIPTFYA